MFDPYNPNDIYMAQLYEEQLIQERKNNPHIGKGMSVQFWEPDFSHKPVCEGRVLEINWDESYQEYIARVLFGDREVEVFGNCLQKASGAVRDVIQGGVL